MDEWPDLPYEWWRPTRDTLHLYTQVVGKLRLALSPFEPQWSNVPLYLTARGLTTSPVPCGSVAFDAELDLFDHVLVVRVSDGGLARIPLRGAVAEFYGAVKTALHDLGLSVAVSELPPEIPDPIPFPLDRTHQTYESAKAHRFWRLLSRVDVVMKRHRARFRGKTSPVHFFWGSFDLANTRFSGRPASPPPYSYPKPAGIELAKLRPEAARWEAQTGLFLLPYEAVRTAPAPGAAILEFLESTYLACATGLGWSTDLVSAEQPPAGTST